MTDRQKAGVAGVGLIAVLTLLLSSQSLPVLQFLIGEVKVFAALPMFGPVLMAVVVGAVAPAWLPHMLPPAWPEHRTKRVTRLLASGIAFSMVFTRYPSAVGAQYGLFAASGAYVLWTMAASFVYRQFPALRPQSLKETPQEDRP